MPPSSARKVRAQDQITARRRIIMSRQRFAQGLALLVALAFPTAGPVRAETDARPLGEAEAARWLGVGALHVRGTNVCSVELISPTEATTAAHCVYDRRRAAFTPTSGMQLVLGQRDGRRAAVRGVRAVAVLPEYTAPGPRTAGNTMPWDIALLTLDAPVTAGEAQPFRLIDWTDPSGYQVDIVGYEHGKPNRPTIRQGCPVTGTRSGIAVATCKVVGGISGAPAVLSLDTETPPILVGTVSSRGTPGNGIDLAYIVLIAPHLAALRALLPK